MKESRKQLEKDRKKSISGIWIDVPASVFMVIVFCRVPALWSGALLLLALFSLGFEIYALVVCTRLLKTLPSNSVENSNGK